VSSMVFQLQMVMLRSKSDTESPCPDDGAEDAGNCDEWEGDSLESDGMLFEVTHKTDVRFPDHTFSDLFCAGTVMMEDREGGFVPAVVSGFFHAVEEIDFVKVYGKLFIIRIGRVGEFG